MKTNHTYKMDFPGVLDHEGRQIVCMTIRTTDGLDESYASKQAEARGSSSTTEELIRVSLVSYKRRLPEGKTEHVTIAQPYVDFDKWSTRARNFVVAAWKRLATPDELELADFFGSDTVAEQPLP